MGHWAADVGKSKSKKWARAQTLLWPQLVGGYSGKTYSRGMKIENIWKGVSVA